MILPDHELRQWAQNGGIEPYEPDNINPASVDLRIAPQYIFLNSGNKAESDAILLLPGAPILATTIEYVRIPPDCAAVLYLKSSMARKGLDHALAGFVDPGFEGELTMELHAHRPLILHAEQRVIQLVLYRLSSPAEKPYAGRYQGQRGPTMTR